MINAKELRIGNNIFYPDRDNQGYPKKIGVVTQISDNFVWVDGNISNSYNLLTIHPVSLTENILLKCGFETKDDWWFNIHIFEFSTLAISIKEKYGEITWSPPHDKRNFKVLEYPFLQYVHQLQNIYYSLTGKELEVKL